MRSTFLTTAILLCPGDGCGGSGPKKDAQEQSQQAEQTQMAHYYEGNKSMDASSPKTHNAQQLARRRSPLGIAPHQEVRRES